MKNIGRASRLTGPQQPVAPEEFAGYELLRRVADRAGNPDTVRVAERIITDERAGAAAIHAQFEPAMDATLAVQGLA